MTDSAPTTRVGRLPLLRALEVVAEVARALSYAHGEGVIHRDIKPSKILVSDKGQGRVTDFGIAKLASRSLTVTGYFSGQPRLHVSPGSSEASRSTPATTYPPSLRPFAAR